MNKFDSQLQQILIDYKIKGSLQTPDAMVAIKKLFAEVT